MLKLILITISICISSLKGLNKISKAGFKSKNTPSHLYFYNLLQELGKLLIKKHNKPTNYMLLMITENATFKTLKKMEVILAAPRGLCAGVERAIEIVEKALAKYGPPLYIKHEIVHNKYVVEELTKKGAIFVEHIHQIPKGALTIFSAHGVSEKVELEAAERVLKVVDATCPLVKKVHHEAQKHHGSGKKLVLIGHAGHPEVEGTSGRVNDEIYLVQTLADVDKLPLTEDEPMAYVTQTTLSVDDTKHIINALRSKFSNITGPELKDICYATQNRQNAMKQLAERVDTLIVIGSQNSSNSNRLKDLGVEMQKPTYLIDSILDLQEDWLMHTKVLGITAGASAPKILLENLLLVLKTKYDVNVKELGYVTENVKFKLPKQLEEIAKHA